MTPTEYLMSQFNLPNFPAIITTEDGLYFTVDQCDMKMEVMVLSDGNGNYSYKVV